MPVQIDVGVDVSVGVPGLIPVQVEVCVRVEVADGGMVYVGQGVRDGSGVYVGYGVEVETGTGFPRTDDDEQPHETSEMIPAIATNHPTVLSRVRTVARS